MIMDGCDVNLITVVLLLIKMYCFVIRRLSLILLLVLYFIPFFVHLKVFYLLVMKKYSKNAANRMRATLACRFTCVRIEHEL